MIKKSIVMATIFVSILGGSWSGTISTAAADNLVSKGLISDVIKIGKSSTQTEKLRGIIDHGAENPIIGFQSRSPALTLSQLPEHQMKNDEVAVSSFPQNPGIDHVVTGLSNRSMLYQKFDSRGRPMSHHQEYARPNAKSLVSSIWDAIDLNPYPGE